MHAAHPLRYRAMLLPRHVVDVLMSMERICSRRVAAPPPPPTGVSRGSGGLGGSGLRSVRVQSAALPAAAVNLESYGPERQTIMYMMADLGNILWGHIEEVDAPGIANCIWCWARLSWHPEPQLLSQVARRLCEPASLAALEPCELARGVWGLSALDALGAAQLAATMPRLREAAPGMDPQQLRAVARALHAAAEGGTPGDDEARGLAGELLARADALRAAAPVATEDGADC
jgi:hypothetical protein